ncbi:MAG: EutN/CcmL family microcompartment protein [Chloroflexi bacterium]|nr:EutN/CcmL family microcompartment protein [Chloroflexota bacterium]
MYIGRVVGNVVATIKHPAYVGYKLLTVARENLDAGLDSKYDIALDTVQAGVGDRVLVLDEGNGARQVLEMEPWGPVRAIVVGIVDAVEITHG